MEAVCAANCAAPVDCSPLALALTVHFLPTHALVPQAWEAPPGPASRQLLLQDSVAEQQAVSLDASQQRGGRTSVALVTQTCVHALQGLRLCPA